MHKPTLLLGDKEIKDTYYLQSPYPVFLKTDRTKGWICIAIAFRYNSNQISVFSPFFESQIKAGYQLWKLAVAQMLQANFNDFHIRVHLGLLHLTSNQYLVPIYNTLVPLSSQSKEHKNINTFLENACTLFNDGLESVNLTGLSTLLNPVPEYSLLNKIFNLSQGDTLNLMARYSNTLNMAKVNPHSFIQQNGLNLNDVQQFD